jgi:hypothetical protein
MLFVHIYICWGLKSITMTGRAGNQRTQHYSALKQWTLASAGVRACWLFPATDTLALGRRYKHATKREYVACM